jgi:hypothetical protein
MRHVEQVFESFVGRALAGNDRQVRQHLVESKRNPFDLELAGLDLGEVENVIDDTEQGMWLSGRVVGRRHSVVRAPDGRGRCI